MIFRALSVALVAVLSLTASGCAATNAPASGLLFTSVSGPVCATDHGAAPAGAAAAPAAPAGLKNGTSETTGFLWVVTVGDASIDTAKKNGSISKVASVDYKHMIVLGGLFSQYQCIVRGD
jgi:hypothetical protein